MAKKNRKRSSSKIGLPPGTVVHIGEQKIEKIKVTLTEYNQERYNTFELKTVEEIIPHAHTQDVTWTNICGLHETDVIKSLGEKFNIHPLVVEDILNTETRPKIELTENYIFVAMKLLTYNNTKLAIESEQVSLILGENFVLTFLEKSDGVFSPIQNRIANTVGRVRKNGPDYLFYALMDVVIDNYFMLLEKTEENIEALDDEVIRTSDKSQIEKIYNLKNQLLLLRKSIWPLREIFSGLLREEPELIHPATLPYLRDLLDHTIYVNETIELQREMTNGLMEVYLSMMSNKMNEVMKLLTIIATIFIPLTFLAGIYGMNFEFMPELGWRWAYFVVWGIMIIVTIIMLTYFRRKKWI
jgi:magnesium transporter